MFEDAIAKEVSCKFVIAHNSTVLHTVCLSLGLGSNDMSGLLQLLLLHLQLARYCGSSVDFVDIDPKNGLISLDSLKKN